MIPVKAIINEVLENLKSELEEFMENPQLSLEEMESTLTQKISRATLVMIRAYYESLDAALLRNKKGRRKSGLVVERRNEKREIYTSLGLLSFQRTYYKKKDGYTYPVDAVVGLDGYERISRNVATSLVESAKKRSYAESSKEVTNGYLSKQTVMRQIRKARIQEAEPLDMQKEITALHIDADEDHVHLQNGRSTMVPLVSTYEGIQRRGKRGFCKNIQHYSKYGEKASSLWTEVLEESEKIYDLSQTKVYIHGDGASWIKEGLEWFPNCVFVLDNYHWNKAIMAATAGIGTARGVYKKEIKNALIEEDEEFFISLQDSLLMQQPEREEEILTNMRYLWNNRDGIRIREEDTEAKNGGATEPHVSHVLSERLSSRPKAWSKETLKVMAPLLAGRPFVLEKKEIPLEEAITEVIKEKKKPFTKHRLGMPDPDHSVHIPAETMPMSNLAKIINFIPSTFN